MDSMPAIFRRAHPTGKGLMAWSGGTADGTMVRQRAQLDNTCQQWDIAP